MKQPGFARVQAFWLWSCIAELGCQMVREEKGTLGSKNTPRICVETVGFEKIGG